MFSLRDGLSSECRKEGIYISQVVTLPFVRDGAGSGRRKEMLEKQYQDGHTGKPQRSRQNG